MEQLQDAAAPARTLLPRRVLILECDEVQAYLKNPTLIETLEQRLLLLHR